MRVFSGLYQLEDRFHDDPGFASTATGSTHLEEAVVCFIEGVVKEYSMS